SAPWSRSCCTPTRPPEPRERSAEEQLVGDVLGLPLVGIAQTLEEGFEAAGPLVGHFEAREHTSEIRAVVAVVEQTDVPAPAELLQEVHQRARTFRELEPVDPFVPHLVAAAADHGPGVGR